ncbi:bifunctional 4-hydroxy-2-oxoglutarate aldolase/2-dehydro-3-deoxy-phosphogluconate aldolase [Amycolatopsis pithecellobii]|uniref:2-dehydro-3-deoxyphosphogluconate aldolase n=1 Tax=Amycolatopsis pithecellobii TaxID=664692 RepID=A0A6N7Z9W2_9PSEU|nr:bifunctional 4-hydroxy-2-oxoglutarate aldolase/2-dehydro-3-deoxy-phosphogluconate aldolase [Amycolatopsis pithecellobii]MTD58525.1 2-dehydro-3-deoxyphosphogluconate aldolase [Amycolatopsis pithecellobii]
MSPLSLADLRTQRCVAIARGDRATYCAGTAKTLADNGIRIMEFPLTTPGVLAALPEVIDAAGASGFVGVGTVVTRAEAEAAVKAGGQFLVTPVVEPDVIAFAVEAQVPILVGACTPTEILQAWRAGATAVKLFPAVTGGPSLVRQLVTGPFPSIPLLPTGGVSLGDAAGYLKAGAIAVGMGGALLGDVLATGAYERLSERVARFRAALESAG